MAGAVDEVLHADDVAEVHLGDDQRVPVALFDGEKRRVWVDDRAPRRSRVHQVGLADVGLDHLEHVRCDRVHRHHDEALAGDRVVAAHDLDLLVRQPFTAFQRAEARPGGGEQLDALRDERLAR